MKHKRYQVHAEWDPEAEVWVATSDDVPGLATESETLEGLTAKLRTMIPELLVANGVPGDTEQLYFDLTSHREEHVALSR